MISRGLYHKSGLVRKATVAVLQIPRRYHRWKQGWEDIEANPSILVNSVPKSGTHLLEQIVRGLPNRRNYGTFLSSMTSSYQFRERSEAETLSVIRSFLAGEVIRGHLFFSPMYEISLRNREVVQYFIYRDPRDLVLSEAHYLRSMNRWHKLHPVFRELPSIEASISLAIRGFASGTEMGLQYPDIASRFRRYYGWIESSTVCAIRFEDLIGPRRDSILREMAEIYARRLCYDVNIESLVDHMRINIVPERSHTFRRGKKGGWREQFTPEHRELFQQVAGDLLIQLGYEAGDSWVTADREEVEDFEPVHELQVSI